MRYLLPLILLCSAACAQDCFCDQNDTRELKEANAVLRKEIAELRETVRLIVKANPELLAKAKEVAQDEEKQRAQAAVEERRKSETVQFVNGQYLTMENGVVFKAQDQRVIKLWKPGTRIQWISTDALGQKLPDGCYYFKDSVTGTSTGVSANFP